MLMKRFKNMLNKLKWPKGCMIVSESTISVTVQDHPANLQAIERYIA
ncbi:hypothetical protein [Candidatus Coxiella mudrowiae]|nr:hypothetical protein [Candidatus Coxiella mudrowiae]